MFSDELWRKMAADAFASSVGLVDGLIVLVLIALLSERTIARARAGASDDRAGVERILTTPLLVVLVILVFARIAAIVT